MLAIMRNLLIIGAVITVHVVLICMLARGLKQVHSAPQLITVTLQASLPHYASPSPQETPLTTFSTSTDAAKNEVLSPPVVPIQEITPKPPVPNTARAPRPPRPAQRRDPPVQQPHVASASVAKPIESAQTVKTTEPATQAQSANEQGSGEPSPQTSQTNPMVANTGGSSPAQNPAGGAGDKSAVSAPSHSAAYLRNTQPVYPPMSRRLGEEGKVVLRTLVSAKGTALNVEIKSSSGHKRLDQAALDAVKRWRFIPAQKEGAPVDMWHDVPIHFSLKNS